MHPKACLCWALGSVKPRLTLCWESEAVLAVEGPSPCSPCSLLAGTDALERAPSNLRQVRPG